MRADPLRPRRLHAIVLAVGAILLAPASAGALTGTTPAGPAGEAAGGVAAPPATVQDRTTTGGTAAGPAGSVTTPPADESPAPATTPAAGVSPAVTSTPPPPRLPRGVHAARAKSGSGKLSHGALAAAILAG